MGTVELKITYIGGPTALLELGGLRLLTDPTFDPAGTEYPTAAYTLRKTAGPALSPQSLGRIDAVLLSHDHHADNLDNAGRSLLKSAGTVLTTQEGSERLGGNAVGLAPWRSVDLPTADGRVLRVTGTPARHGPAGGDRGPVAGFVLALTESPKSAIYISGDTVLVRRRLRGQSTLLSPSCHPVHGGRAGCGSGTSASHVHCKRRS